MSERQKVFYALIASAFFHLLVAIALADWASRYSHQVAAALPDLAQLEVTIMPAKAAPAPKPAVAAVAPAATPRPSRIMRPVLDSDGLTTSKVKPANPVFESDANMQAGSELPATGNLPLPTQNGPSRNFTGFKDQQSSFGKGIAAADAPVSRPAPPVAQAQPAQTPPTAITQVQPTPVPAMAAAAATPPPKPAPTPSAIPKVEDANGYAMGSATPTPPPAPSPMEMARLNPSLLRGHADMESMTHTRPAPAAPPAAEAGMRQEIDKTKINGGITRHGPAGVDAAEGPFGKYHRQLGMLIGSRWNHYVKTQPDLITVGDVTILIKIEPSGKVTEARVIENHANDGLAALSIKAIMDCTLPPIPDDLAPMLRDGHLEIPYTFNVYDPNQQ